MSKKIDRCPSSFIQDDLHRKVKRTEIVEILSERTTDKRKGENVDLNMNILDECIHEICMRKNHTYGLIRWWGETIIKITIGGSL
jgi:hypothetical protein